MTRRFHLFDRPDRFVTGTVGQPGQRTFFLQAVQGHRIASVTLEKAQVAVLADRIGAVLAELQRRGVAAADTQPLGDDERPLDEPLREEFRVGTLTISWDGEDAELVVEARSQDEDEETEGSDAVVIAAAEAGEAVDEQDDGGEEDDVPDDAPDGPDVLRVRLALPMALGFARRAARLVAAGRPACPFCGRPLDPEGHICPRTNGYLN